MPTFVVEKICLNAIRYGIYLSLFTPFIFSQNFYSPFIFPKTIFFQSIIEIVLVAYVVLNIFSNKYRPRLNILNISIIIFFVIIFITSLTGVNFEKSFWNNFERMNGLFTLLHVFVFFVILSSIFKKREDWEKFFTVSILTGISIIFFVLFTGQDINGFSTMGNSSFLAAYLLFDIFFAIILFLIKSGIWKIFYGLSLLVLIPSLLISDCKGAIVSFFVGLFLFLLEYFIFFQKKLLKFFILGCSVLLMAVVIVAMATPSNFVKNELKNTLELPNIQSRIIVWEISQKAWQEKFLLGWGQENFNLAFDKYFDPKLILNSYGGESYFDKAHNIILDTGVTSGIFGVLSYLSIFSIAFFIIFKTGLKSRHKDEIIFWGGIIVLLIIYFLQNLILFDTINTYLLFFLVLSSVVCLVNNSSTEKPSKSTKKIYIFTLGGILILVIGFAFCVGTVQAVKSSFYLNKAVNSRLEEAIPFFDKALKFSPISEYETIKNFSLKVHLASLDPAKDKNVVNDGFAKIIKIMEESVQKNPSNFYLQIQLGTIYNDLFRFEKDEKSLALAESVFQKAIFLSTENQLGYWGLAETKALQGKQKEQFSLLREAIYLNPSLEQSYVKLFTTYRDLGQEDMAHKIRLFYTSYPSIFSIDGSAFLEFQSYMKLYPKVLQYRLESRSKNIEDWGKLAIIYEYLGEKEKKEETIKKIREINPKAAIQIEKFLLY